MTELWAVTTVHREEALLKSAHLFDTAVTVEGVRDFLQRPGHVMLLAWGPNGEGIGFVSGVEMRHPDKQPEMFLYELGVDERFRRRGVATSLLRALRDEAIARGCDAIWTGTERDNVAALAAYRAVGAEVEAESVFIVWDGFDARD